VALELERERTCALEGRSRAERRVAELEQERARLREETAQMEAARGALECRVTALQAAREHAEQRVRELERQMEGAGQQQATPTRLTPPSASLEPINPDGPRLARSRSRSPFRRG
jgi:predicted  nucleic acid-binding Zn-ribbon protein